MALTAPAYPPRSPAPWAEAVPGRGPATVDELLTLPDDGYSYEVVERVLYTLTGPVRALTLNDSLDGEDAMPGFSFPVAELFRDPLAPEHEEE